MLKFVEKLTHFMAVLGGVVLTFLILLTCVSVMGRGLNTLGHSGFLIAISQSLADWLIATGVSPVTGDFELVEAGVAFSIFSFLPYVQLYGGHATVDIFTNQLPRRAQLVIMAFWETVLSLVIILITWRLYEGMLTKYHNGQTTFLLEFPIWWAFAASLAAAVVASVVACYSTFIAIYGVWAGHSQRPNEGAAK